MQKPLLLSVPANAVLQNAAELILEPVAPLADRPSGKKKYDDGTPLDDLEAVRLAAGITYDMVKAVSDAKKAKRPYNRDVLKVDSVALRNRLTDAVAQVFEVTDVLEKRVRKARKNGVGDQAIQPTLDVLRLCWADIAAISSFLGEDVQTLQARSVA